MDSYLNLKENNTKPTGRLAMYSEMSIEKYRLLILKVLCQWRKEELLGTNE